MNLRNALFERYNLHLKKEDRFKNRQQLAREEVMKAL